MAKTTDHLKIYFGNRINQGVGGQRVMVEDHEKGKTYQIDPRNDLRNHSPDGLNWGYGGSGAAQCALAILAHCVGDELAQEFYQDFKWNFVSKWGKSWFISNRDIKVWIKNCQEERGKAINGKNN